MNNPHTEWAKTTNFSLQYDFIFVYSQTRLIIFGTYRVDQKASLIITSIILYIQTTVSELSQILAHI